MPSIPGDPGTGNEKSRESDVHPREDAPREVGRGGASEVSRWDKNARRGASFREIRRECEEDASLAHFSSIACQAFNFLISSTRAGITSRQSPTTPKRDERKIAASGSELIETIALAAPQPAMCWPAPEIPTAR